MINPGTADVGTNIVYEGGISMSFPNVLLTPLTEADAGCHPIDVVIELRDGYAAFHFNKETAAMT